MSIATVAPDAIDLAFSGRFGFGIYRWAYLPFDVPAGVQRIRVSTSHEDFAVGGLARNVLDLGIFGPAGYDLGNAAGFRGWSGGARDGFVISSTHATPGYLAGPIDPGVWAVALGPVVLSPWGMAWQVHITMERGESVTAPPDSEPVVATVSPSVVGARWYRGDLHLHTVHSDGQRHLGELASTAHASGLDFIVSTEHNTNAGNRAWPACDTGGLLVIPGEEVTTRHGHWLAVGLPPRAWVDWRYGPRDGVFPRFAAEVRQAGGLVVAAHPSVPLPGSAWEFGLPTWMPSRYGTAGGTSMTNCHFASGSGCCGRTDALWRSAAATRTASISRSARRRPSCMPVNCRHPRSLMGYVAGVRIWPDRAMSHWN